MLTCPHCGAQRQVLAPKEGTNPILCHKCLKFFDYVCENGVVRNWAAPKVIAMIYKGAGKPGGS